MKKTFAIKKSEIKKNWYLIDAEGVILGKLAVAAANILRGKNKSIFSSHIDTGDNLIIINAAKVRVTGNKEEGKKYFWHSWYPGGIKSKTFKEALLADPSFVIRHAVKGMLPKNRLQDDYLAKLRIYDDVSHNQEAQKPIEIKVEKEIK